MEQQDYVDTRGAWPMYCNGQVAITLVGKPMDITVEDARVVAKFMMDGAVTNRPVIRHQ